MTDKNKIPEPERSSGNEVGCNGLLADKDLKFSHVNRFYTARHKSGDVGARPTKDGYFPTWRTSEDGIWEYVTERYATRTGAANRAISYFS